MQSFFCPCKKVPWTLVIPGHRSAPLGLMVLTTERKEGVLHNVMSKSPPAHSVL